MELPAPSAAQKRILQQPLMHSIWLEGRAGCGKSTVGLLRLLQLLERGTPAEKILIFVPQRSLAQPYLRLLGKHPAYQGGQLSVHTLGSLSLQLVELFWFLIAAQAGFKHPLDLPHFLSLEMVQAFMTRALEPLLQQQDYFNSVRIDRARLYSQIADNMNKAAMVGFPIHEIAERLKSALGGGIEQAHIFDDAQACARAFRCYCLAHNLVDFSLRVELFNQHLQALPQAQAFLQRNFQHLIADNVEEDNPSAHHFLRRLLPQCQSALLICDSDAGFRRFLGADPIHARSLRAACALQTELDAHMVMSPALQSLGARLAAELEPKPQPQSCPATTADPQPALYLASKPFQPQILDWTAEKIAQLVQEQALPPAQIVVLAPFLSDMLRFGLRESLRQHGIPTRSHRPSRALREERAARCLLTFARLAHPHWQLPPAEFDLAFALLAAIDGLDLLRAKLLCEVLYRRTKLLPFEAVQDSRMQDRITFGFGERYDALRAWIERYIESGGADALDIFFRRIYGELLSRPGFGFHKNSEASNISMNLVESARNYRWSLDFMRRYEDATDLNLEYVQLVERGLIADFYLRDWVAENDDAVLLAPAYTFLQRNQPVDVQFWLNAGSDGWARRLYQPLTHPDVLSLNWPRGTAWTDEHEQNWSRQSLRRLLLALTRRCRKAIYIGYSALNEGGYEQRGLLLETLQEIVRNNKQRPLAVELEK